MSRSTAFLVAAALAAVLWTPLASGRTTDGEQPVPNVIGMPYQFAWDTLDGEGFIPTTLVHLDPNTPITDQCPHGGTLAAPGSTVRITIGSPFTDCPDSSGGGSGGGGGGGGGGSGVTVSGPPPPQPKLVPLIFIPGIMGSKLFVGSTEVWPGPALLNSEVFGDLALTPDLQNVTGADIQPGDPVLSVFGAKDVYDKTVAVLHSAGYVDGDTLFLFGYDWRYSADSSVTQDRLAAFVQHVRAVTGRSRVDILAHSQGGLVATSFLATHSTTLDQYIRRVATIATPLLGAAKAIGIAKWATGCEAPTPSFLDVVFGGCFLDPQQTRTVVRNMPGVYELLPTSRYALATDTSPITSPNGLQLSYEKWTSILQSPDNPMNAALLNEAAVVHSGLIAPFDPAGAPYKVLRIIGNGPVRTPVAYREVPRQDCIDLRLFCRLTTHGVENDTFFGDGTVPAGSASLVGVAHIGTSVTQWNERPASIPNVYVDKTDHMHLAQDPRSVCIAVRFFGGSCPSRTLAARTDDPTPPDIDGNDVANEDQPAPPTGIEVSVTGSADVSANDLAGNPVPSSSFLDEQLLGFVDPGTYSVSIRPLDAYPLQVQIDRIGAGVDQQTTFYLPSPHVDETYTLPFTSDEDLAGAQLLDGSGNAIDPAATANGDTPPDGTPPTTIAGGTITPTGTSSVQLLATDDASGVGSSWIATGGPAVRYAGPFEVPLYSTVTFLSVDKQGNVENPQSIVADDAPGYRALAAPISVGDKIDRTIFPQGDEDWFRFTADGTSDYRAQLYGLTSDYDLELVGADGSVLQAPHTRSSASEQVRGVLPAGTYYLHVVGFAGANDLNHPYKLKLQTLGQ